MDYTLSGVNATEQTRYLAGAGVHAQQAVDGQGDPITYLHGDLTRSTMLTTDENGSAVSGAIYTAFGEPVTYDAVEGWRVGFPEDIGSRYGYDGGWGYDNIRDSHQFLENPPDPATYEISYLHGDLTRSTMLTNELGHAWTYTYGAVGNVATVSSPLTGQDSQTWTLTWEHPTGTPASFYRESGDTILIPSESGESESGDTILIPIPNRGTPY